jgi:ornithine cyclodeaminase/alanine dehydrogenase-like protein (mu-crystallin family)
MLYLTEAEVRQLLPMREAIRLMRETFRGLREGTAQNQPRRRLMLPTGSVLHAMAGAHGKYFGTKIYATNAKHGSMHFLFWLLDAETATPLALIEANWLGQIRTGAASGYATDLLARGNASTLGIIGSGFQARSQVEAVSAVRQLREVRVWSRNVANRETFADACARDFGLSVRATSCAREAVEGMDIVATATWAKDPVIEAAWISPGTHINAMGSNHPQRRELPADLIARADRIVCDSIEQAKIESGDLLLAWTPEEWRTSRLKELKDTLEQTNAPEAITIFKSNGLGVEDVAAGAFVYEQALERGLGRPLYSGAES